MPNLPVYVDYRGRSACYPRGNFYPLIDGPSIRYRQVTRPAFRLCSRCLSHSQAPLCPCTRRTIPNRAEGTFGRLRYLLGGDRPSQTAHQALSPLPFRTRVRTSVIQGWYPKVGSTGPGDPASQPPTYPVHASPKSNAKLQ